MHSSGRALSESEGSVVHRPLVTVIMPIRNEASFIARSLGSVLAQDYPARRMEVLIADGMSDDETRDVVRSVAASHPVHRILVLDNPEGIVPTGLNLALERATGEIIIRVDGHCEIPPDYVSRCVEALRQTGADCAGGVVTTVGAGFVARAIATAQSSSFGVGGVAFRTGTPVGTYVDTLAFGAYRRSVFDQVGGFDEELVRNQDDEFNFRLVQAGGKIWMDPALRILYYSRSSLGRLWRQYYQYGLYKVRVIQKRGAVPSWRHLVPALFILALSSSVLLGIVSGRGVWALLVAGPYVGANLLASVWAARKDWITLPLLPIAFSVLHVGYGAGFLHGLWRWREHFRMRRLAEAL